MSRFLPRLFVALIFFCIFLPDYLLPCFFFFSFLLDYFLFFLQFWPGLFVGHFFFFSFLAGLFVALIEKVCIADYQLRWQDFVATTSTFRGEMMMKIKTMVIMINLHHMRSFLLH